MCGIPLVLYSQAALGLSWIKNCPYSKTRYREHWSNKRPKPVVSRRRIKIYCSRLHYVGNNATVFILY